MNPDQPFPDKTTSDSRDSLYLPQEYFSICSAITTDLISRGTWQTVHDKYYPAWGTKHPPTTTTQGVYDAISPKRFVNCSINLESCEMLSFVKYWRCFKFRRGFSAVSCYRVLTNNQLRLE